MNKENRQSIIDFITLTASTLIPCTTVPCRSLPSLKEFIHNFFDTSNLPIPILLLSLIYLLRLQTKLPASAKGASDTPYRLFLASVLTSSKYLSDHSLTSAQLCQWIGRVYTAKEINSMERSFLSLLDYDLWVTADHWVNVLIKIKTVFS
ncbi:unnamed protein product [Rhizopus stolonifer]